MKTLLKYLNDVISENGFPYCIIKEIKDDSKKWSPSAEAWIVVTISSIILIVAVIFVTSFTYWLCCIG
jgi:hypothetical protein